LKILILFKIKYSERHNVCRLYYSRSEHSLCRLLQEIKESVPCIYLFISKFIKMETQTFNTKDTAKQNVVAINRVFDIPIAKVWQALTTPEGFKKWWGPNGYTCPVSNIEARIGGKYFNCMRAPDGKDNWSIGTVQELVPEKKLVITDSFADERGNIIPASKYGLPGNWPKESLITFELREADGATKLKLTHVGIPDEAHDDCKKGWNECFDKLEHNIK